MNVLALAGLIVWPAAHLFYLLHSEFRNREPIAFDIEPLFPGSQTLSLRYNDTCPSLGYTRHLGLFKAFF
jgi:hypothetical protein